MSGAEEILGENNGVLSRFDNGNGPISHQLGKAEGAPDFIRGGHNLDVRGFGRNRTFQLVHQIVHVVESAIEGDYGSAWANMRLRFMARFLGCPKCTVENRKCVPLEGTLAVGPIGRDERACALNIISERCAVEAAFSK